MNRLQSLRKKQNKTQADIADLLGVNVKTISRWEKEESPIKPAQAHMIADLLGVNVGYLLGDSKIADPKLAESMLKANSNTSESTFQFSMEVTESDEHDLLYNYRQLSDPFKNHAREYVRDLKKLQVSIENDK